MSIKKSFGGQTIRKPGSYSKQKVDNSSGSQLGATDTVMIVGESLIGAPGSNEGIQSFSSDRLSSLVAKYGSGPLVDCALSAVRPAKAGQGISGASEILVWKTNQALQAAAFLKESASNIYQVKDRAWGLPGNNLSVIIGAGSGSGKKSISVARLSDTTESLGENPANSVITIQYTGNGSAATSTISGSSQVNKTLVTALTGQSDGSVNLNVSLKNYNMKSLVDFINAQIGYTATLNSAFLSQTVAYQLDPITAQDIRTAPYILKMLQYEILNLLNSSVRIQAFIQDPPVVGPIDNATTMLAGGAQGASANSDFSNGFAASLGRDYNSLLSCVSRDASEDIADVSQGFTDPASSYTIQSVLVAQDINLQLRGNTKNRKEAQGWGGVRKSTKSAAFAFVASIGDSLMQVTMQDILALDASGSLRFMHPHVLAALCMGMRAGQEVGEPITHKFPNVQSIGHFINPLTGISAGDFDPSLDYDAAIDSGVLFLESANGGFRVVVDNTTYGIDDSFVFNRGSVIAASQFVNRSLRQVAEKVFVGRKLPAGNPKNPGQGAANSIKNVVRNKLRELNAPDVNIISSSADAPEGFIEDTFVVTVTGNTALVEVEYKPVQALDFVFFSFTLGDVKQSA